MSVLPPLLRRLALVLALSATAAWADGTLTHMSGPVSVQKSDGRSQAATVGTQVGVGDTLITGAGGYARMEMSDGGEMVLRPESQLQVQGYTFVAAKPAEDSFVFSMLRGGLRTVTGLIGKRGNRDAYELKTQTATIGIRGTQFDLRVCQASCGALADGTYLAVRFGAVQTSNAQGSLAVAAGQVAYAPPQRAPVMLPRDPGIGFTPPAVIPKLDEKKKLQAAAAAAASPAGEGGAGSGAKKADVKSETKAEGKAEGKAESKSDAKTDAKSETKAKAETPGQAQSPQQAQPQSETSALPQSSAGGGQVCAVE